MGTTANKLLAISNSKVAIRDAIVAKGVAVPVGTALSDYATKISEITSGGTGNEIADAWIRPTEWLSLPDNVDGVQKVSILNAIFDTDSELVAFICRDNYTVDWGDGVVENFSGNMKAEHKYTYSDAGLNSDTVANFGYKQCIITITPQLGQNLSYISLNTYHPTVDASQVYDLVSGFLDMRINSLLCTWLGIGSIGTGDNVDFVKHRMLEQCLIGELGITSLSYLFAECYALQSVSIKDTSNITSFYKMHYNNYSLQKMPNYTFRSDGVSVDNMFENCYSLVETYPINITINSILAMFYNCRSLRYIDLTINSNVNYSLINLFYQCSTLSTIKLTLTGTGKVTSLNATFAYTAIKESPVIDTSLCTNFSNTFQACNRLVNLYDYNYTMTTTLSNMLNSCYSLKDAGYFNTTSVLTQVGSMCINCSSLEKAPVFANSSGVTSAISMLSNCYSLKTIPAYVFGNITLANIGNFLANCNSLQVMPAITIGSVYTSNPSILSNCYSLKRMLMPLKFTFSVANAKMSTGALNEMYSILPTITGTSQTVTVTGNYGATGTPVVSLTKSFNEGSKIVAMTDTTNLSVGMFVAGIGTTLTIGKSCTFTDSGNLVTSTGHSLIDGDIVSFNTINGPTGIVVKTIYYVVNATTNTFQLSLTQGGSVIGLVAGAGSNGIYNSPAFITAITHNVSIELSLPMVSTGTASLAFRSNDHKTYLATMKDWTVTG